jgi:hypothetical protein
MSCEGMALIPLDQYNVQWWGPTEQDNEISASI